jgi:hypothetical protein
MQLSNNVLQKKQSLKVIHLDISLTEPDLIPSFY